MVLTEKWKVLMKNNGSVEPINPVKEIYGEDTSTLSFTEFDFDDRAIYGNDLPRDTSTVCFVYHKAYKEPRYAIDIFSKKVQTWKISGDKFINKHTFSFDELGIKYTDGERNLLSTNYSRQSTIVCSNIEKTSPYCIIKVENSLTGNIWLNFLSMKILNDENGEYLGFEGQANVSDAIPNPEGWYPILNEYSTILNFNDDYIALTYSNDKDSRSTLMTYGLGMVILKIYPATKRFLKIAENFSTEPISAIKEIYFLNSKCILAIRGNSSSNKIGYLFLLDAENFHLSNPILIEGEGNIIGITPNGNKLLKYIDISEGETKDTNMAKFSITDIIIDYYNEKIIYGKENTYIVEEIENPKYSDSMTLFGKGNLIAASFGGQKFYVFEIILSPFSIKKIKEFTNRSETFISFPDVNMQYEKLDNSTLIVSSPKGGVNDKGRLGFFSLSPTNNIVVAIEYNGQIYYKEDFNSLEV